jgi:hypothetical protein
LAELAMRYFQSHGPAPRKDFAGWAGITAADAKAGIAANGDALTAVAVDGVEMLAASDTLDGGAAAIRGASATSAGAKSPRVGEWVVVPGFDEYLLGYKERSLMVDAEHMTAIIPGGNGVFRSTLVRDGRVMATWKRTLTKKAVKVEVIPVLPVAKTERKRAEAALQAVADFVERDLQVSWA